MKQKRGGELRRIGAHVRALRLKAGLTQAGLAERAGLHRVTISRLEAGTLDVGVSRVAALAAALAVEPGALWGENRE